MAKSYLYLYSKVNPFLSEKYTHSENKDFITNHDYLIHNKKVDLVRKSSVSHIDTIVQVTKIIAIGIEHLD